MINWILLRILRILDSKLFHYQRYISQFYQMIRSISRKHKIIANNPHMIVLSSAQAASEVSLNQCFPVLQSDRNTHRNEVKPFKIRAFAIRGSSSLKQPQIEGKKIVAEAIECIKQQSYSRKERRPSVQIIRKARQNISEDASVFAELQIHEAQQSTSLIFTNFDNSSFIPLSHSPIKWFNQSYIGREKDILLVISVSLLSLDSKKRPKSNQKNYQSQKSVGTISQQHEYSDETQNILKSIGRGQGIFSHCRTFIKTSCQSEMTELKEFIELNKLNHIEGLINIRTKLTDIHNIYSLREIIGNRERLLIMQDQEILQTEIPLVQNQQTLFMTFKSKSSNMLSFNKCLQIIKNSTISGFNNSQTKQEDSKENINPNILLGRSFKKQSGIKKPTYPIIKISSTLKQGWAKINFEQIIAKITQNQQSKKLKLPLRQRRSLSANQCLQQKNISKQKHPNQKWHREQGPLGGDFKQKMIKYVKILEHQKLSIKPREKINWREKEEKLDDLQEITMNVTSKLKSKTSYQLVGDLIRLNAHTARQIHKYQMSIAPFTNGVDLGSRDVSISEYLKLISNEQIRNKQCKAYQIRQKFITYSFN